MRETIAITARRCSAVRLRGSRLCKVCAFFRAARQKKQAGGLKTFCVCAVTQAQHGNHGMRQRLDFVRQDRTARMQHHAITRAQGVATGCPPSSTATSAACLPVTANWCMTCSCTVPLSPQAVEVLKVLHTLPATSWQMHKALVFKGFLLSGHTTLAGPPMAWRQRAGLHPRRLHWVRSKR